MSWVAAGRLGFQPQRIQSLMNMVNPAQTFFIGTHSVCNLLRGLTAPRTINPQFVLRLSKLMSSAKDRRLYAVTELPRSMAQEVLMPGVTVTWWINDVTVTLWINDVRSFCSSAYTICPGSFLKKKRGG